MVSGRARFFRTFLLDAPSENVDAQLDELAFSLKALVRFMRTAAPDAPVGPTTSLYLVGRLAFIEEGLQRAQQRFDFVVRPSAPSGFKPSADFPWQAHLAGLGLLQPVSWRRRLEPSERRRSCRWDSVLPSGCLRSGFFSAFAPSLLPPDRAPLWARSLWGRSLCGLARWAGLSALSPAAAVEEVPAVPGFLRPRPPRLPRRRLGRVGSGCGVRGRAGGGGRRDYGCCGASRRDSGSRLGSRCDIGFVLPSTKPGQARTPSWERATATPAACSCTRRRARSLSVMKSMGMSLRRQGSSGHGDSGRPEPARGQAPSDGGPTIGPFMTWEVQP